jgi:DNA-binding NtrC family response regulator
MEKSIAALNRKILIVDDEPDWMDYFEMVFKDMGLQIYNAKCGEDALILIRQTPGLDMILTDYRMPRGHGPWLAQQIQDLSIPIVITTNAILDNTFYPLFRYVAQKPLTDNDLWVIEKLLTDRNAEAK